MEKLQIPQKERKVKMITVPVTRDEHDELKKFCHDQNVTITSMIRYALKNTYHLKTI